MCSPTPEAIEIVAIRLCHQERLRKSANPTHFPWENAGSRQDIFRADARDLLTHLNRTPTPTPLFIATVIREHNDTDTRATTTKPAALAWLRETLFLDDNGATNPDNPTPTFEAMRDAADQNGWVITLNQQNP